jgi:short-subunit dehydrogenase
MASAVRTLEEKDGAVGVLVNNAGYGQEGAFEEVAIDKVRVQFETNVFGLTRLTQMVLPDRAFDSLLRLQLRSFGA